MDTETTNTAASSTAILVPLGLIVLAFVLAKSHRAISRVFRIFFIFILIIQVMGRFALPFFGAIAGWMLYGGIAGAQYWYLGIIMWVLCGFLLVTQLMSWAPRSSS